MNILGLNSVFHESSAAVVVDGRLVCAAEEERFNRIKHAKPAAVDTPHVLPWSAIEFCLDEAGLTGKDLDALCYSFNPALRRAAFTPDSYAAPGDWGDPAEEAAFLASVERVPEVLSTGLGVDVTDRFRWVDHHEAHALSGCLPSGFDDADVLVVDGIGEYVTSLLGHWDGSRLEMISRMSYPDSLGFVWEKLSSYLGFTEYDACKVMGLAAYGDPSPVIAEFARLVDVSVAAFTVDADLIQFRRPDFAGIESLFGEAHTLSPERRADIAAALQGTTDEIMMRLASSLYETRPSPNLVMAGGVALNCQANWQLLRHGPFEQIYIPCAPHDAGTAVGAAFSALDRAPDPEQLRSAYLGPSFADAELVRSLTVRDLPFERVEDPAALAAELIDIGQVVAWFQGRMELGPRALGNRSLLADPRDPETRELLNHKVKHREPFRPFAPAVLAEYADDWFELGRPSDSYQYMLYACPVRPDRIDRIPAVVHRDGTSRVQIVSHQANPPFHRLISKFHERTGVPMVLNTSFNDSEPIVCTPDDAVNTFTNTRIDTLILGHLVVRR